MKAQRNTLPDQYAIARLQRSRLRVEKLKMHFSQRFTQHSRNGRLRSHAEFPLVCWPDCPI
jgi:hypothetical protein